MIRTERREQTLGELFGDLARETNWLIRQEAALAKREVAERASAVGRDAGWLAAGAAIGYAGLLAIVAAAIFGLGLVLPLWLAALVVGLVLAAAGFLLVQKGLSALRSTDLAPRQTLETLKENAQWAKDQVG